MNFNKNIFAALLAVCVIFVAASSVSAADADNSPIISDDNNFEMTVPYNAGTGFHWEISSETHGVEVLSTNYVQDHSDCAGSSRTAYFNFKVMDDDFYVKLVLISPSGDIVKEVDSDMIN